MAYLRKIVEERDFRLETLEGRIERVASELRAEIDKARSDLEALTREQLREAAETHLEWRYAGLTLLFVGLALATAANLV